MKRPSNFNLMSHSARALLACYRRDARNEGNKGNATRSPISVISVISVGQKISLLWDN